MLRLEPPHPYWHASLRAFADSLHERFTRFDFGDPDNVDDVVTELNHVWYVPVTRPPVRALNPRGCPTWWEAELTHEGDVSKYVEPCHLERGHASPHVNFANGSVRLGHEPFLQHYTYEQVRDSIPAGGFTRHAFGGYTLIIAYHWWLHLARTHDCHTCAHCPSEVW